MRLEDLGKPTYTIKEVARFLEVHVRTVVRMIEDKRLDGQLVDTPRGKIWMISPISVATLLIRKSDSGKKQYPRAKKE